MKLIKDKQDCNSKRGTIMPVNLRYVETIELPYKLLGSYSLEISANGYISIATPSALYIYQIYPVKDNMLSSLSVKRYNISPSSFVLSESVGIDLNLFLNELPQSKLYEGILNIELASKLKDGSSVKQKFIKSSWSPINLYDCDCLLATLSNVGSLEIFVKTVDATYYEEFKSVFNLTKTYVEKCKDTWQDSLNMTPIQQYNELKHRIHKTLPTAFTWTEKLGTYCVLIVAHACGDISFWKVKAFQSSTLQEPQVSFMNVINAKLVNISILRWAKTMNNALLFIGNWDGQVSCLKITNLDNEEVVISSELEIWIEKDQISVNDIKFFTYLNENYALLVKGSDLIILLFNEDGGKIDSYVFHAGNIAITAVERTEENRILVVSLTGAIKDVIVTYENSKMNVQWKHLYVNINSYIYQTLNLVSSINKVIFLFLTGPCKVSYTKDEKNLNSLVVFFNTGKDPLDILLSNRTNNLKDYWDCLEVLRYQTLLDKQLPLTATNFEKCCSTFSLYKLKLSLWISKLSETIYEQTGNVNINIKSYEDFYQLHTFKMTINRISHLLKLYESKSSLTQFQLHNIFILNSYLKEMVAEDMIIKLQLGDYITLLLNIISRANMVEYTSYPHCLRCGETLMSLSCLPPHFDMRCSISFMQISKYPDYKCTQCGSMVHTELETELNLIVCPFCDIPMQKRI